jgi:translocation and assembly module TamB
VLLVVLAVALVLAAATTERGTRLAWQSAVRVLGGRLAGTLEGGSLATGVRLRDFAWTSPAGAGTEVRIDRLDGRWALTRAPWRLSIAYLRAGTVDVRIVPGPSKPSTPPQDLRVPLQLRIDDLRVDHLAIHEGASTTQLDHLALNGRSDGRHHERARRRRHAVRRADRARQARRREAVRADGHRDVRRQALGRTGQRERERVGFARSARRRRVRERMKLNSRAHVEEAPRRSAVTAHASSLGRSRESAGACARRAGVTPTCCARLAPDHRRAGAATAKGFAVTGPVSIVNAKPGTLGEHLPGRRRA